MKNNAVVLDSFAIIGFLKNEPSADIIQTILHNANDSNQQLYMNTINFGEVIYTCLRQQGIAYAQLVESEMLQLPVNYVENDWPLVKKAAFIKWNTPISYANCFVAATAQQFAAKIVTGDPEFKKLEHAFEIEWLPQR
ncbi:type II toxin-antitoxin system VapC family toxin [candidate division KSB1 bacterium]|nr:type II toxin-antitoxin system VapC family toxin [candidate division KSB1 bacterium]